MRIRKLYSFVTLKALVEYLFNDLNTIIQILQVLLYIYIDFVIISASKI